MHAFRSILRSRAHAAIMAVVALALQASSNGYVAACPMKSSTMAANHACCQMRAQAAGGCHAPVKATRKACCFLGVMSPCADGTVSEARLTAPTSVAAPIAEVAAVPALMAALPVPVSTAAPPILEAPPHRSSILLI